MDTVDNMCTCTMYVWFMVRSAQLPDPVPSSPALGKPGSARRHAVAIACARAFHPRAGASADERMPVRALAARAVGAAGMAGAAGVAPLARARPVRGR